MHDFFLTKWDAIFISLYSYICGGLDSASTPRDGKPRQSGLD